MKSQNSAFRYYKKHDKTKVDRTITRTLELPDLTSLVQTKAEGLLASSLKRLCLYSIVGLNTTCSDIRSKAE